MQIWKRAPALVQSQPVAGEELVRHCETDVSQRKLVHGDTAIESVTAQERGVAET
jgi:hypothetical protein